jgi:hypothetical protein
MNMVVGSTMARDCSSWLEFLFSPLLQTEFDFHADFLSEFRNSENLS